MGCIHDSWKGSPPPNPSANLVDGGISSVLSIGDSYTFAVIDLVSMAVLRVLDYFREVFYD